MEVRTEIAALLNEVERDGIPELFGYMDDGGFFTSPASTKFHNNHEGGLADHSLAVYRQLKAYNTFLSLDLTDANIIIAALLHDLCKMGAYIKVGSAYLFNRDMPSGHGSLSVFRAKQFIALVPVEKALITYHMGVWNTTEAGKYGEYSVAELIGIWKNYPASKFMAMSDEVATMREMKRF